jgi:hypothetical protein
LTPNLEFVSDKADCVHEPFPIILILYLLRSTTHGFDSEEGASLPRPRFAAIVAAMASCRPPAAVRGRGEASAADPAADPAGPEAIGPAEYAAGVLVVDRDPVGELDAPHRPELAPDRRRSAGRGPRRGTIETNTLGDRRHWPRAVNVPADQHGRDPGLDVTDRRHDPSGARAVTGRCQ